MNDKIKEILVKNGYGLTFNDSNPFDIGLKKTIIEICELQKEECADEFRFELNRLIPKIILKTKNVAE